MHVLGSTGCWASPCFMLMHTLSSMLFCRVQAEQVAVLKNVKAGSCLDGCVVPRTQKCNLESVSLHETIRSCSDNACKQKTYPDTHF